MTTTSTAVVHSRQLPAQPTHDPSDSSSRIARRVAGSKTFWITWLRRPASDVAEAVMRLRRLRGLSQQKLAQKMGTKQPAIARIEAGDANTRLSTLIDLAEALDATVRVDLEPVEVSLHREQVKRWWDAAAGMNVNLATNVLFHTTINVHAALPSAPAPEAVDVTFEMIEFDPRLALPSGHALGAG